MAQEQNLVQPILDEALILECIEQNNLQKITKLIGQFPIDPYFNRRPVTLKGGKRIFLPTLGNSILALMIECNYLAALRAYAQSYPIEDWDVPGLLIAERYLHRATVEGNQAIVELLIKGKADLFSVNLQNQTALHLAAIHGHAHLIEPLVQSLKAPPPLDDSKESSVSRKWHKGLYQEFLKQSAREKNAAEEWTALGHAIQRSYWSTTDQFIACYKQLRAMAKPFDAKVAEEAARRACAKLPGTKAQAYFDVVAILFAVGAHDPSQSDVFPKSVLQRLSETTTVRDKKPRRVLTPAQITERDLRLFFVETVLNPYIIELFQRPKYAAVIAFLGGIHHRTGARSLFQQLQRKSAIFDPQVLRLALKLAGAPKKLPVTSAFFLPVDALANASSASSASTARVDGASSQGKRI